VGYYPTLVDDLMTEPEKNAQPPTTGEAAAPQKCHYCDRLADGMHNAFDVTTGQWACSPYCHKYEVCFAGRPTPPASQPAAMTPFGAVASQPATMTPFGAVASQPVVMTPFGAVALPPAYEQSRSG
jgi:hypothetical protein